MLVFGLRALRAREPAARPARVAVFVRNGRLPSAQNGAEVLSCGRLERYNVIIEGDATTGDNTGGSNVGGGLCLGCGPGTGSGYLENVIVRNNSPRGEAVSSATAP
ncbi:MAG: hypothetical protein KatS3mg061_0369 [Dehalococcoidia bacterium]|nr:MAG: hypothetical protein KatS3mg061_0369 [Dehalococcoidia bacterium]